MTVTSRFFEERSPVAERAVANPYPNPPAGRLAIGRLSFIGPSPKRASTPEELARSIEFSLPDADFFLDTNVFTRELDGTVWNALFKRRISIIPSVFKELMPWLKDPFCNKAIRENVLKSLKKQAGTIPSTDDESTIRNVRVLLDPDMVDFVSHGWDYYFRLLALRKLMGPLAKSALTKQLGRAPHPNEFHAEIQGHFGERGALLARKGLDAFESDNLFTDERLVLSAVFNAVLHGSETFIVTRDPDLLEQYVKILCLIKEHYRAMFAAERYADDTSSMDFMETPVENDGEAIPIFKGATYLRFESDDVAFDPLPPRFTFVNIYCMLLGGSQSDLKVTSCAFCAEREIARLLLLKAKTGGLSTDRFNGRNCLIRTEALSPERHKVIVSIGEEMTREIGALGSIGIDDLNNTLFCNELRTSLSFSDSSDATSGMNAP